MAYGKGYGGGALGLLHCTQGGTPVAHISFAPGPPSEAGRNQPVEVIMRACMWMGLAVCSLAWCAGATSAGEQEEIKALVEDAIAARGGEAALKKVKAAVWRSGGGQDTRPGRPPLCGPLA